jgi:hypothetical protein
MLRAHAPQQFELMCAKFPAGQDNAGIYCGAVEPPPEPLLRAWANTTMPIMSTISAKTPEQMTWIGKPNARRGTRRNAPTANCPNNNAMNAAPSGWRNSVNGRRKMIVSALQVLCPPELELLISDNGPQFIADAFAQFIRDQDRLHVRIAPRRPCTNGIAERFVRTLKEWRATHSWNSPEELKALLCYPPTTAASWSGRKRKVNNSSHVQAWSVNPAEQAGVVLSDRCGRTRL